jgi:prepilin-type processing-associated H-X9-DG protein
MIGKTRSGFTLVEIVLLGFLVAMGATVVMSERLTMTDTSKRVKCASNLRMLGQACLLYANENKGAYPRTRYDVETKKWVAYSNYKAEDPFKDDGPEVNDVTAAFYLLLRTEDITSEVFICPSTTDVKWDFQGKDSQKFSNFPNKSHLSYSFANPYFRATEDVLTTSINAEYAIAGDMNPGGDELMKIEAPQPGEKSAGNSRNHGGEGQNVLYGDGHVEWQTNPFVGLNRDNIYTPGEEGPLIAAPVNINDTVLLPTEKQEPPKEEK